MSHIHKEIIINKLCLCRNLLDLLYSTRFTAKKSQKDQTAVNKTELNLGGSTSRLIQLQPNPNPASSP